VLYTVLHPEVRAGRKLAPEPPPTTAPAGPVEVREQL